VELLHPNARLIDAATETVHSGASLRDRVAARAEALPEGVVFLRFPQSVDAIVEYLAAWQARRPVALLDPALPADTLETFVDRFEPALLSRTDRPLKGYHDAGAYWRRDEPSPSRPHEALGILLTTSGSTGDPKLVRLARSAVAANTRSIIAALGITGDDVAISTLPFFYSFGLSVLNTHLAAGATLVVESGGLVHRAFWDAVDRYGVTSLACVPYQFEMLRRLRFDPAAHPSVRTLTQAGGRLKPDRVRDFYDRMSAVGGSLFVMYGQTEAAPRLTTLPAAQLPAKLGSVGPAVPGGRLSVRLDDGTETTEPGVRGEVLYRGPNVMLGYAETADDLTRGDECGGLLETGDLGHLDADGYLYIDGRLKRFGKVFGVRLNLDDVEAMVPARYGPAAAVSGDEQVVVYVEHDPEGLATELAERLNLHWSGFAVRRVAALPLLGNGKVDYRVLEHRDE
jgi:acyl-CoA synthetase (AMP-forming)/AMP-acid ligase II